VVSIASCPHLSSSTTYALVLQPSGAGDMYWRGSSSAGSYPNGSAYEWNGAWQAATSSPRDQGFRIEGTCP